MDDLKPQLGWRGEGGGAKKYDYFGDIIYEWPLEDRPSSYFMVVEVFSWPVNVVLLNFLVLTWAI